MGVYRPGFRRSASSSFARRRFTHVHWSPMPSLPQPLFARMKRLFTHSLGMFKRKLLNIGARPPYSDRHRWCRSIRESCAVTALYYSAGDEDQMPEGLVRSLHSTLLRKSRNLPARPMVGSTAFCLQEFDDRDRIGFALPQMVIRNLLVVVNIRVLAEQLSVRQADTPRHASAIGCRGPAPLVGPSLIHN